MAPAHAMPTSGARVRRARCDAGGGGGQSDLVAAPAEIAVVKVRGQQIAGCGQLRILIKVPRLQLEPAELGVAGPSVPAAVRGDSIAPQ